MRIVWTPAAADLEQISDFLFEQNPATAVRLVRQIFSAASTLKRYPNELIEIASDFFPTKTVFARNKSRTRDVQPVYLPSRDRQEYSGAVVILTGAQTGSSSELLAAGMQETGRAKIVGSQSCGCVLGVTAPVELKDGGEVIISQTLWFSPHGRKLEGEGVIPDRSVAITFADLQQKRDPVLEEGERVLKEMAHSASVKK
jgi:C-terminal processing protease CtpA/Prc